MVEGKAIEKRRPWSLAVAEDATIQGQISPADLEPPVLKLVQRTSREHSEEGVETGMFVGGSVPKKLLRGVVLRVRLTRVLWDTEIGPKPPLCASDERVRPRAGGMEGPCALCKYRKDNPELEANPRLWCGPAASLLFYDMEDDFPYIFRLNPGTQYRALKRWLALAAKHQFRTWAFPTEISAASYKGQKGTYERLQMTAGKPFSPEEAQRLKGLTDQLAGVLLAAPSLEEEAEPDIEGDEVPSAMEPEGRGSTGKRLEDVF